MTLGVRQRDPPHVGEPGVAEKIGEHHVAHKPADTAEKNARAHRKGGAGASGIHGR